MKRNKKKYFDFTKITKSRHRTYKSPVYSFDYVEVERNDKKDYNSSSDKSSSKRSMEKEIYDNTKQKEKTTEKIQIPTRRLRKLRNPFS